MISKRIDRGQKASSFENLGHYVLEAKNEESQILWTRTAEYVVDKEGEGEKILWYRITNCESDVPAMAIAEVLATQAKNTRATSDKTYHLVVSFPEGETPTKEQMEDIEDRLCKEMGYGEHQRISAVHKNTDNIHLHVAINKIHPTRYSIRDPLRDYYIRDKVCRELELKHGLTIDNGIGQGQGVGLAFDAAAHHGQPSFIGWVQKNVRDQLLHVQEHGRGWQDFHAVLGEYGLHIRKKGAGFVIGVDGRKRAAKASSIDRNLSFKALTDRFGEFEPSKVQVEPKQVYQETKHHDPGTKALFDEFLSHKAESKQKRQDFKEERDKSFKQFQADLKNWAAKEREQVKNSDNSVNWKRGAYSNIAEERKRAWNEYKQADKELKTTFYAENPFLTWEQYLMRAAEQGNVTALAKLRNTSNKQEQFSKLFLTADNPEAVSIIIFKDLKPITKKNGALLYKLQDGGSVTDEQKIIRVDEHTAGAVFVALSLASEKFQWQPLNVQGTDEFKSQIVEFSVKYGMDVTFKNPKLEQERQRQQEKVDYERLSPALKAFVEARNELHEQKGVLPRHRMWKSQDAGQLLYQGLQDLTDGSRVTLWKKADSDDNTMLVKPVEARGYEFRDMKIGQRVTLNEEGHIQKPKGRSQGL